MDGCQLRQDPQKLEGIYRVHCQHAQICFPRLLLIVPNDPQRSLENPWLLPSAPFCRHGERGRWRQPPSQKSA